MRRDGRGDGPVRRAREGLSFATVRIAAVNLPCALPPRDGVCVKNRFRLALGLRPA